MVRLARPRRRKLRQQLILLEEEDRRPFSYWTYNNDGIQGGVSSNNVACRYSSPSSSSLARHSEIAELGVEIGIANQFHCTSNYPSDQNHAGRRRGSFGIISIEKKNMKCTEKIKLDLFFIISGKVITTQKIKREVATKFMAFYKTMGDAFASLTKCFRISRTLRVEFP